jgi:hypothetical protein
MPTSPAPVVPSRVRDLAASLVADLKPMRAGSVGERAMKCGRKGCACASNPDARHGPYYCLTKAVKGKTRSRYLTAEQAELARQQIDAGREFHRQVDDYLEAVEEWADGELKAFPAPSQEAEKGGFKRDSRQASGTKSFRKSKRS